MSRLILVRHGAPEMDPDLPASAWHLSAVGMADCHRLAEELAAYEPDHIFSSPERRAFETARILAEHLFVPMAPVVGLEEHHRATVPWMGQTAFQDLVRRGLAEPDRIVLGEETAAAARARFTNALTLVVDAHPGETLVIVTHGTVLSLYVAQVAELPAVEVWEAIGPAGYVVLREPGGGLEALVGSPRAGDG